MGLEVNGVVPTEIKHCGISITDLSINEVGVWGKPYTLSYSTNSTYTIKVTRIESPYQNASLGELSTGSIVYYGDKLTIIAERTSGYYLTGWTINDYNYTTDENITRLERDWVVDSAVTISASTKSAASWHSLYSGSSSLTFSIENTQTFSGVPTIPSGTTKIRVTATYKKLGSSSQNLVSNYEISVSNGAGTSSNLGTSDNGLTTLYILVSGSTLQAKGKSKNGLMPVTVYMTKVEAYY